MKSKPRIIYWDTCIFLAWIKNEPRNPDQLDGIAETIEDAYAGNVTIATSAITRTELLESKMTPQQAEKLNKTFMSRIIQEINVDPKVGQLAKEIRDFYRPGIKITFPDALHLACAIIYDADEMHTFDGESKDPKPDGLLQFNGNVAGHPLKICTPAPRERYLFRPSSEELIKKKKPKKKIKQ